MPTIKQQFEKFHFEYPDVYATFASFAQDLRWAGVEKVRADEVMHRTRWEFIICKGWDIPVTGAQVCGNTDFTMEELKVLFSNHYAMKLIEDDRSYDGFFDLTITHGN